MLAIAQSPTCGFHADKPHFLVGDEFRKKSHGVGTAAHAGDAIIGQPPFGLQNLGLGLTADDGLEFPDHDRIRMRSHGGTEQIVGIPGILNPGHQCLVHGLLQGLLAALGGHDLGPPSSACERH